MKRLLSDCASILTACSRSTVSDVGSQISRRLACRTTWGLARLVAFALIAGGLIHRSALADTFGSGANTFEIEFVAIGQPGNPPDTTDRPVTDGAVPYEYRIGKYEISEQMIDKANALGGLGITKDTRGPDKPATSVSWFEAAQFVNWLNTSTGSVPAYKFDGAGTFQLWLPTDAGYNPANLYRNRLARYFLPSLDEWHKAAYYDPLSGVYYDYPTGSDSVPDGIDFVGDSSFEAVFDDGAFNPEPNVVMNVGLLSGYGSAGQGGNVTEWIETAFDRVNDRVTEQRREQGGPWVGIYTGLAAWNGRVGIAPHFESPQIGFRIAGVIPEPPSCALVAITVLLSLNSRIRRAAAFQQLTRLRDRALCVQIHDESDRCERSSKSRRLYKWIEDIAVGKTA